MPAGHLDEARDLHSAHADEVREGKRFEFGKNWKRFLTVLNEDRIAEAEASLRDMLRVETLEGKRFLDAGSGSGLFSLAARRLGAEVHSFDYDPESVACTRELHRRFAPGPGWVVEHGSVLDKGYLEHLGQFDVVYSWGVLHHTGSMWEAVENVQALVAPDGLLFIALYNDQGAWSRRWNRIKRVYCSGLAGRTLVTSTIIPFWIVRDFVADLVWRRNPIARYSSESAGRGMSMTHDWIDWLGGYPFEVAKPEAVFDYLTSRGFRLEKMTTAGGTVGCNEFVARRER